MHIHISVSMHFVLIVVSILYAIGILWNAITWGEAGANAIDEHFSKNLFKYDWWIYTFDMVPPIKFFAKLIVIAGAIAAAIFWLPIWIVLLPCLSIMYRIEERQRRQRREAKMQKMREKRAGGLSSG